jgi:predicted small secreted protein
MKKTMTRILTVALLGLSFAMAACTGDTTSSNPANTASTNTVQDISRKGTLQGKIVDATTGAAVGGSDLKVYLIQGTSNRTPEKLTTTGDLTGEYAFTNIPLDTATNASAVTNGVTATNANFKIVVIKAGYQRFEGEISPTQFSTTGAVRADGVLSATAFNGATGSQGTLLYDAVYNKIGNIYLYPVATTTSNYTVKVRYNGAAVPGATVELKQVVVANTATIENTAVAPAAAVDLNPNVIAASPGLIQTISATTDASGNALFKGTDLVLGGCYMPVVLPWSATANALTSGLPYAGQQTDVLERRNGAKFIIGAAITNTVGAGTSAAAPVLGTEQTVAMTGASNNDSSLYITAVSNSTIGDVLPAAILTDSGALTITFNRPVTINNNNRPVYTTTIDTATGLAPTAASTNISVTNTVYGFGAAISSTANSMTAVLQAFGATAAVKPVVATLDVTQTKLTLTPSFSTGKAASDYDLKIRYYDTPQAGNLPAAVATTVGAVTTTVTYVAGANSAQPSVSPVGKPELQYGIFSNTAGFGNTALQVFRNGAAINSVVRMTAPAAGL